MTRAAQSKSATKSAQWCHNSSLVTGKTSSIFETLADILFLSQFAHITKMLILLFYPGHPSATKRMIVNNVKFSKVSSLKTSKATSLERFLAPKCVPVQSGIGIFETTYDNM